MSAVSGCVFTIEYAIKVPSDTKNGMACQKKLKPALATPMLRSKGSSSALRTPNKRFVKASSHANSLMDLMFRIISFINPVRRSRTFICTALRRRRYVASIVLTGTLIIIIATPMNADQPSKLNSDTNAIVIWNTADHKMCAYIRKSGRRLASTLIRLTTSPVDRSPRDLFDRRRLLRKSAVTTPARARIPAMLTSWKY